MRDEVALSPNVQCGVGVELLFASCRLRRLYILLVDTIPYTCSVLCSVLICFANLGLSP